MTETPKTLPPEQLFGIAKKLHLELDKLTIVDHAAIISMLNTMAQHREMSDKFERQQQEQRARDEAMADAKAAHEKRAAGLLRSEAEYATQANVGAVGLVKQ